MNYKTLYKKLITSRKILTRKKNDNGLLEAHHILPKSLGGTNNKSNMVLLTPREHYLAHWILYKSYHGKDKSKMAYAFFKMCQVNNNQQRVVSSRQYERAKIAVSDNCSGENHPNYGKQIWSTEQKNEMSKRMLGSNNPQYGKVPWNKGLTAETSNIIAERVQHVKDNPPNPRRGWHHTDETKQKLSKIHTGKKLSDATKKKISEINKGKKLSDETKQKMSDSRKGKSQNIVVCPHCGKHGGYSAMHRWHFDNCKQQ